MPTDLTNIRVTNDAGDVFIDNGIGTLTDDRQGDNSVYITVRSGAQRPRPLVKNDIYRITCKPDDVNSLYSYLNFICTFTGDTAEFRLQMTEPRSQNG